MISLSTETLARIQQVEAKLAELDPIMLRFCTEKGCTFRSHVGVWPRRSMWARQEVDRCLHLTMDLTVQEVMNTGFHPEMPWSLYADASLPEPPRIVCAEVFRRLPFRKLTLVLEVQLELGWSLLRAVAQEEILARGEPFTR